ncbi:N-acetylmuramoyl-L-alanine amidase [Acinetobacter towneri]|uniref:N-acetylmuramoyl-L-alanine amidase n=1 Tax=Acinetobacter towneri TaxID=202956 RepID=UPI002934F119|nr:N-acetylmuramoyl-L-alanine amidase [Acinetobacter towneri]WOE29757.1 N-acetylmuramoyl-L-alanine amidase [Acinetobacter towneri]
MKLIDNWKQAWRLKSVQVGALSAFFYVLMYAAFELLWLFGSNFPQFWAAVPQELKELLPHSWVLWLGFLNNVLGVFARLKAQPELHTGVNQFVAITAGHSNTDPGAVNGNAKEADLVVNFRNAVAFYLREAGLQVKTDGTGTKNDPLSAAVKLIKGSSVAVEFHMNAAASKQANGIETIALPKDKELAQDLSKAVADALGSRLRGGNGWIDQSQSARGRLAFVSNGGLIVELGFISNPIELKKFNDKYWIAAKAVAKVLIDYEKALK